MKKSLWILLPLLLTSCVHFENKNHEKEVEALMDPAVRAYLDKRVTEAETLLEKQNFVQAEAHFAQFEKDYPQNIFLNRSKLGHARALAGEGKNSESIQLYHEVIDSSLQFHPEFVALASYYASFSYEALGDESKTIASLNDAKAQIQNLPVPVAKAELPARLAAFYNREGNKEESRKYYRQAEQGVAVLYQENTPANNIAKAKTYFLMGELSSNQVTVDNLPSQMDTLALTQIFLLRSIEMNLKPWSAQALENLQNNYRDIWNAILQVPKSKSLDALAAEQEQREAQVIAIGHLQELTQKIRAYQTPEQDQNNPYQTALFKFLDQIDIHSQEMLASLSPSLVLTPEAQKRETLRHEGVIHEGGELPKKETTKPPTDPNLQGH